MYVLDASALAKSFLDEPQSQEFRAWLDEKSASGTLLLAPRLAFSEVGRIIQKECIGLPAEESKELHLSVFIGITVAVTADDARAWNFTKALTYYDAEYVHLADLRDSTLVSADDKQLKAAAKMGVKVLSFSPTKGPISR